MVAHIHFLVPFKSDLNFLRETLVSITAQSTREWKATIFNDSSLDTELGALIESFNEPRFDLVNNPSPLGIGGNWNTALAAAEAEFACLVHADDVLAPSYARAVLDLHHHYPDTYGVFTGVQVIDHKGRRRRLSAPDIAKKLLHPFLDEPCVVAGDSGLRSLLRGDFIFCPSVTYRVSRLHHPVFDEQLRMSLDLLSFAEAIIRGERFVGTKNVHYHYRRHTASTTSTMNADSSRFDEELLTYRRIASAAADASLVHSARTGRRAGIVKAHLAYVALSRAVRGNLVGLRRLAAIIRS
jgi:glycosyltransferase involved in cell wall biosynthesis